MIEGNIGSIHHYKAIAMAAFCREYRHSVIDGAEIAGNLLDGFRNGIPDDFGGFLRNDLEGGVANDHLKIFFANEHITMSF